MENTVYLYLDIVSCFSYTQEIRMSKSDAGKGSWYRPVDTEKYNINWEFIQNPPICECCGQPMKQWVVGKRIAYCNNKECDFFTIKIERM